MDCPKCKQPMVDGSLWLSWSDAASRVLFSPTPSFPSAGRRFSAGTFFFSGPKEGEVEVLQRSFSDTTYKRPSSYCTHCQLLVTDVR